MAKPIIRADGRPSFVPNPAWSAAPAPYHHPHPVMQRRNNTAVVRAKVLSAIGAR